MKVGDFYVRLWVHTSAHSLVIGSRETNTFAGPGRKLLPTWDVVTN